MSNADQLSAAEAMSRARAAAGFVTFKIQDRKDPDIVHVYRCMPHGLDGSDWCMEVAALVGLPLSRLLQGNLLKLFSAFMAEDKDGKSSLSLSNLKDVEALIKQLDKDGELNLSGATHDLIDALKGIGRMRLASLLKYTTRDGFGLDVSTDVGLVNLEAAYRQNWGEWREALTQVFKINGFADFLVSTSESGNDTEEKKQPSGSEKPAT